MMSDVSQTPDQFGIRLLSEPRQNWALDCTSLRKYPLLEVFPGKHACLDLSILYRCLDDKIYFLLQDAYPDQKFGQLMGYVFEEYFFRLLRRFTYEGDILVRTFYANPRFEGTNDEAGDALIFDDQTTVVMELKARLLTTRERFGGFTEITLKRDEMSLAEVIPEEGRGLVNSPSPFLAFWTASQSSPALDKLWMLRDADRSFP